jgi:DNA-binding NarL/FixJ family response regulator
LVRLQLRGGPGEAVAIAAVRNIRVWVIEEQLSILPRELEGIAGPPRIAIAGHSSARQGLGLTAFAELDAVVLSIASKRSGLKSLVRLHRQSPSARILVVDAFPNAQAGYRFLLAGACGYVARGDPNQIVPHLEAVAEGGLVIESTLARDFWTRLAAIERAAIPPAPRESPTVLELEVLRYLAKGLSNRELGRVLALGRRSVRTHLSHIYRKLEVRSQVEATVFALRAGWIEP